MRIQRAGEGAAASSIGAQCDCVSTAWLSPLVRGYLMGGPGCAGRVEFTSTTFYDPSSLSNSVRHSAARSASANIDPAAGTSDSISVAPWARPERAQRQRPFCVLTGKCSRPGRGT